jgi:hypothetical protein
MDWVMADDGTKSTITDFVTKTILAPAARGGGDAGADSDQIVTAFVRSMIWFVSSCA